MNVEAPRAAKPIDKRTLSLADNVQGRIARGEDLSPEDHAFIATLLKRLDNRNVRFSEVIDEQRTLAALTGQILTLKQTQGKASPDPGMQVRNRNLVDENARLKEQLTATRAQKRELSAALEAEKENKGVKQLRDDFEKVSADLATATSDNQRLGTMLDEIKKDFSSLRIEVNADESGAHLQENFELFAAALAPLVPKFLDIAQEISDKESAQKMKDISQELHSALYKIYFHSSAHDHARGIEEGRQILNTRLIDGQDKIFPIQASNRLNAFGFMMLNHIQPYLDEVDDPEAMRVDFGCINVHRRLDSFQKDNLRYYEIIELAFELKDEGHKTSFRFPFYMVYAPNHFPNTPCVVIPPQDLEGENSEGKKADLVLGQHNPWFDFDNGKPIKNADRGCDPHCNLEELPINRIPVSLDEAISILQEDVIEFLGTEGGYLDVKLTREIQELLNLDYVS